MHARTHARTFTRTRVWSPKHWDLDALTPIWSRGHPCVEINERPSGGICLSGKFIFLWSLRACCTRLRNDRFTSTRTHAQENDRFTSTRTRFTWCARASHFFHCCNRCKKLCAVVLHKTVCEGYHNQKKKKKEGNFRAGGDDLSIQLASASLADVCNIAWGMFCFFFWKIFAICAAIRNHPGLFPGLVSSTRPQEHRSIYGIRCYRTEMTSFVL